MSPGSNYNSYGGPAPKPVCAPPPQAAVAQEPELRVIQSGIEAAIGRLGNLVIRVEHLGDYVFGPCPQPAGLNGVAPAPPGIVYSLKDSVSTLHSLLGSLEEKLERLSRL